jgi:hypothetical protein
MLHKVLHKTDDAGNSHIQKGSVKEVPQVIYVTSQDSNHEMVSILRREIL